MAFARLLLTFLGPMARVPFETAESMLEAYDRCVSHQVYGRPLRPPKTKDETLQAALLAKVDRLTVPDADLPLITPPTKPRGRRRR
jgi:hypothetical protein